MDRWEACIEEYQESQTLDSINSVLHTAEGILKEDLAPFEFDWFVQTLLSEPVSLLCTISARLADNAWTKILKDAYQLLSDLAERHYEAIEQYIDPIVLECQKPQEARTRSRALYCLASCIKRSMSGANASQYIAELANATTCKGPLALLVGTMCEYHPEAVTDQYITIWRTYLNLLGSNKNSDLVCTSLLKGVWCLFKNFGSDIPLREISEFYDKLTRELFTKCESAVLQILRDYANLFKERLAEDAALRRELWTCSDVSALLAVYREIATVLGPEMVQTILQTEIIPRTTHSYTNIKFTALRICSLYEKHDARVQNVSPFDACALEFELRSEVAYDTAEAVHWCIESNAANSEKLLQTSILFYNNIPASKRKVIVVDGLLNAPTDVFNTTLNFLTTQSCHDESSLLGFLPLWRDIFDSQLLEKRNLLFEKYLDNFLVVVDNFLEDGYDDKKLPEKLSTLLSLTSHILTLQPAEDSSYHCEIIPSKLVSLSRACGLYAPMAAVARALIPHVGRNSRLCKIFQMIQIDKCKDESLLCEACLALIQEPDMVEPDVVLKALEVIFTRKDAEPKTLIQGIRKLEQLIVKENNNLDTSAVSKIIKLIERPKSRKDMSGKDARILQRDVTVFLGKYWNTEDYNPSVNLDDNSLIVRLKEVLTLDVPNPVEGTSYKIKLGRLLRLAINNEDEDALRMMINIICANRDVRAPGETGNDNSNTVRSNTSALLQQALGRAIVSLCRATVGAARQKVARDAAAFCDVDATMYILKEVTVEKSPAVRRMLSDVVECILLKDQGTGSNEALLKAVYKEVRAMMESDNSILKLGGLDVTVSLLSALKSNTHLTKEMLPNLLMLISKTFEQDLNIVFDQASALFIENSALFPANEVDFTVAELLKNSLDSQFEITNDVKARIFKNMVKSALNFCKALKIDEHSVIQKVSTQNHSVKFLYLWSELPKSFDIKDSLVDDILCARDSYVLDSVFNATDIRYEFALEAHLRFLNQYASVLLKSYSTQTLQHIGNIIENLPPKCVKIHRTLLSELLTHVRQILHSTPDMILKSFESWSECVPIKDVTEHLQKEKFMSEHAISVNSLRIMVDIFKLKDPTAVLTTVSIFAKTWSKTILKIYASGHIKYLKKEVPYLTDLLSLSLQFLPVTDVKNLILEGQGLPGVNKNVGVDFCRFFISVFIKYLLKKPFILLQNGMEDCWVVLNDVVKWSVRKRWHDDQMENVLELLEQLWPTYVSKAPFASQYALLLDLSCINRSLFSGCVAIRQAIAIVSDSTSRDERIAVLPLLPGGEACSETYRRFASSLLPTRLSDMNATSSAALRALLDALAGTADTTLLDIVVTLALGDDSPGWWDDALTSCMSSLSTSPTFSTTLLSSLESRARESPSVCRRIFLPLLRYAPTSICESFFSSTLKELLESLGGSIKAPSIHPEYAACVQQRTFVLDILQLLFEKVPASKIESPSSSLYKQVPTDKPWHLARVVISHSHKLREKIVIPDGATVALANICREFQYAAYKCMCVCLCVRRPDAKMYNTVLDEKVWERLVDESAVFELPLKTDWNQRKIVKSVSIRSDVRGRGHSYSSTRSPHPRVFLRTLSENPLEFDLVDHDEEQVETQDILLPASSLSGHPISGTLTALLAHLSAVSGSELDALCRSLETAGRNAAWLLAQAVCNNKEQFKQQATELRPALLAALVNTKEGGLNSLHIDTLNTLILWKDDITLPDTAVSHLNTAIHCLVATALNNTHRTGIFKMLDKVLDNMLKEYGSFVVGDLDIDASFDDSNRTKSCLKLLLRFSKNNVRVPNLLSMLLTKLERNHKAYRTEMTMLAELIGIEISNSNELEKRRAAEKLSIILKEIKKNNISDYVKILHHSGCCDQQQFRTIVDTTQKLPEADRKRCLRIISTYISQHPGSDEAGDVPPDIRQMAERVSGDRCFEELFKTSQHVQPPAKKPRMEVISPILNTIDRKERLLSEALTQLGSDRVKKACDKMSQDNMATRLVESFYLAIYLPLKYNTDKPDLSVCLSSFYEMLFHHLKSLEMFRSKRLRDEPLVVEHPIGLSRTRTNRVVGTLRTFSYKTNHSDAESEDGETGVDVQVSIEKILDTFVQFAKVTPEAGMELLTQLLRCLGRGFEYRPVLAQLLSSLVEVAPQTVFIARECVDQLSSIDGFLQTVEALKKSTLGSEGEQIFRLLHEETVLRCRGPEQFALGNSPKEEASMADEKEFAIKELETAFQALSNWDQLTIQDKRRIEDKLPILWAERTEFKTLLGDYKDTGGYTNGWFGKMVSLYNDDRKDLMKWLRGMERWPRRQFVISAVTEAMQWHSSDQQEFDIDKLQLSTAIQKDDCLAEWAARLMLRNVYLTDKGGEDAAKLSRSHELRYCERANEMGLHNLALSVIKRNCLDNDDIEEDEIFQWTEQNMIASAARGLALNDRSEIEKAVKISKLKNLPGYSEFATPEVILSVNMLRMKLEHELKSLSPTNIEETIQLVESQVTRLNERSVTSHKNKQNLEKLYETAVLCYDSLWDQNVENNEDILLKLCSYLDRFTSSKLDGASVAAIILNRLDKCEAVSDTVATTILAKLKPIITDLPDCYLDQLRAKKSLFSAEIIRTCGIRQLQGESKLDINKQRLQLLCDADYLLLQYCEELHKCLTQDPSKWEAIFLRMERRIFENHYAGSDYQALARYKAPLNEIRTADPSIKGIVLKGMMSQLREKSSRPRIRMEHVCPWDTSVPDAALDRLLRLPKGENVVRILEDRGCSRNGTRMFVGHQCTNCSFGLVAPPHSMEKLWENVTKIVEELIVYTDSVRRPCVVTVLTSSGKKRRYLLKNEDLRADSAAQCLTQRHVGYHVIPLSEDCGLIEFLEDHKRLRELITSTCDVDSISVKRQAAKDDELILAPKPSSIQNYIELCSKIPAYSLRSAIEEHSSSVEDFVNKKRRFLETLSDVTISNWLFGLGDRHLQNMLYSVQDGGVVCIDWGAIFKYGGDELPPARLTRNLLAVCDTKVLESKLQSVLSSLRDSNQFLLPVLKLSFKWLENFDDKLVYIQGILQGKMVAHEITKDALQKSNKPHVSKYIEMLDYVFSAYENKEQYSVEEQVSNLLMHCTDPWILSVTRMGWEPWL